MKLEPHEKRSRIMGVLNVTPDSFSDGGVFNTSVSTALRRAEQLVDEGARIIDVGGQSTRPGASRVSAADEIARVAPVLKAICERFKNDPRNVAVSVDTFYGEVVKAADEIGVDIINDVSGGDWDAEMLSAVANTKVPLAYILSHQRGSPDIMDGEDGGRRNFIPVLPENSSFAHFGVAMLDRPRFWVCKVRRTMRGVVVRFTGGSRVAR